MCLANKVQPLFRPQSLSWQDEIRVQLRTALPSLACMLLFKIPWLISLRFVGGIGALELAAAALATSLCSLTGFSLSVGVSSALATLSSQSRGHILVQKEVMTHKHRVCTLGIHEAIGEESLLLRHTTDDINDRNQNRTESITDNDSTKVIMPLMYLYRGLFIQLLFVGPIGIWWIYGIQDVLTTLGQDRQLAHYTDAYLRILTPVLWSFSVNWTLTVWLQTIEMAHVPVYAACMGLALHIPLNHAFIYTFGWGYLGCAAASVVLQLLQPVVTLTYLFGLEAGRARLLKALAGDAIGRTKLSFWIEIKEALNMKGCLDYLSLAFPGIVLISEWWASEISIFLAGQLVPSPDLSLGALTLYQSINTVCFMFPTACGIAGSVRVGYLLGAGDSVGSRFASNVSIVMAALVSGALGLILYFSPHTFFPSLFAPDEPQLVYETARTIPLLAIYVFADGVQAAFNGTIKGCGRQAHVMPVVVVAYWIIGLPLAYYIAFVYFEGIMCTRNYFCGQVGLVAGMAIGTWIHMLLLGVMVWRFTNWEEETKKATKRMALSDINRASSCSAVT